MAVDITTFESIIPSRFLSFVIPDPTLPTRLLRVALLDSPIIQPTHSPRVAALFVPENRESDWVFSTESGHFQLLLSSPGISRLILIGKNPIIINPPESHLISYYKNRDTTFVKKLENSLKSILIALSPKSPAKDRIFNIPILDYEDNLICSVVLERCVGVWVGEMLVEDVEIEKGCELDENCGKREFRRRLRFKRMPNLIQTEIRVVPETDFGLDRLTIGGEVEFRPDIGVLVHPYLIPMVASLSLVSCHIENMIQNRFKPKALCLGVGGGALLSFLKTQLGFEVFGVEMDEEVIRVGRKYFGLKHCEIQVFVGDAMEFLERIGSQNSVSNKAEEDYLNNACSFDTKFDVVMVDLDSCDARNGISAPPLEFIESHVLSAVSSVLCDFGILIMNVIPPSRAFYDTVIHKLREFFHELYEIDVGNGENFVLVAKMLPVLSSTSDSQNTFIKKLREVILGKYLDSVKKI